MQKDLKKPSKKRFLIAATLVLLVAAGSTAFYLSRRTSRANITYSGPTEQDIKDAQNNKQNVAERKKIESQPTPTNASLKSVTPVITNANQNGDQVNVTAYIGGIYEDSGKCKLTATMGDQTFTKTDDAFADATTTSCAPFLLARSDFSETGTWSITIEYTSTTASGKSDSKPLVIK